MNKLVFKWFRSHTNSSRDEDHVCAPTIVIKHDGKRKECQTVISHEVITTHIHLKPDDIEGNLGVLIEPSCDLLLTGQSQHSFSSGLFTPWPLRFRYGSKIRQLYMCRLAVTVADGFGLCKHPGLHNKNVLKQRLVCQNRLRVCTRK